MGSRVFINSDSRKQLPFLRPDEPVPFWKIIKNVIGQDLTKVSLPVILNEPLSALQRFSEIVIQGHDLFVIAAKTDDPVRRMAYAAAGLAQTF